MGAAAESYDYHLERANDYFKVSDFEKAYLSAHEATLLELRRPEAWLLMAQAAAGRVDWDKEWKRRTDDTVCWEHCEWCFKEALVHADADTNSNLAYYYWQLGRGMSAFFSPHRDNGLKAQRFAEAGQYLNTALTLYREQLDSNPDDFGRFVELRFATIDLVENHLRLNRFRDAFNIMKDVFREVERGGEPGDGRFRFYYAKTRLHHAISSQTDTDGVSRGRINLASLTSSEAIGELRLQIAACERDLERARETPSSMSLAFSSLDKLIRKYNAIADEAGARVWDSVWLRKLSLILAILFGVLAVLISLKVAALTVIIAIPVLAWPVVVKTRIPRWELHRRQQGRR